MDAKRIEYSTTVFSFLDENGYWNTKITISDRRSENGMDWKEEKIEAVHIDIDRSEAERVALQSALQQLDERVYSRGYSSLIEAVEEEERNATELEDNQDTTT